MYRVALVGNDPQEDAFSKYDFHMKQEHIAVYLTDSREDYFRILICPRTPSTGLDVYCQTSGSHILLLGALKRINVYITE